MPVQRQPVVGVRGVLEDIGQEIIVIPAAHPARQFLVTADPAAVLRRTGIPSARAADLRRRIIQDLLDSERVVPAVTEVVLVPERVALDGDELVKAYVVLRDAVLALVEVEGRDRPRWGATAASAQPIATSRRCWRPAR